MLWSYGDLTVTWFDSKQSLGSTGNILMGDKGFGDYT